MDLVGCKLPGSVKLDSPFLPKLPREKRNEKQRQPWKEVAETFWNWNARTHLRYFWCVRRRTSLHHSLSPLPKSQFLDKVQGFLGVMAEANKRLQQEAKNNSEAFDIEALTGNESEVIEMDLMLGVADLHTPEAVNAAEGAIAGHQPAIYLASQSEDYESSDESDSDREEKSCFSESNRKQTKIIELS